MFFGLDLKLTEGSGNIFAIFAVRFEAGPWRGQVATFPPVMANSEWWTRILTPGAPSRQTFTLILCYLQKYHLFSGS